MTLIESVTKVKYDADTSHERLRSSVPKKRIIPSPHRYSENEDEMEVEDEEEEKHTPQ